MRSLSIALAIGIFGLLFAGAAQDPPFDPKMRLKGSTTFVESNWNIDGTAAAVTVAMASGGLTFDLNDGASSEPRIQFRREFRVEDGVSWAWFRIKIDDVDEVGFYLGLYSLDSDPRNTEPTYGVYFTKGETDTQVDLRSKDDTTSETVADQFTITDETPFELAIKMDGSLANNKVTFYWRESPTDEWDEHAIDNSAVNEPVPDDVAKLHYSMLVFNDSGGTSAELKAEIFEAEAPTDDD